jgi:hypothetical protein
MDTESPQNSVLNFKRPAVLIALFSAEKTVWLLDKDPLPAQEKLFSPLVRPRSNQWRCQQGVG